MSNSRVLNHKLHITISVITLGGWLLFYALMFILFKLSGSTIETRRSKRASAREKRLERRGRKKEHLKKRKLVKSSKEVGKSESSEENWRELFERDLGKQRQASTPINQPPSLGYKKGKRGIFFDGQAYILSCGHEIRSSKRVGWLVGKGLLLKTVWCEVCNTERTVTSTRDPWKL